MNTTWKHTEREIARLLGGKRSGVTGVATVDVQHPWLAIEVKHRKQLPAWLNKAVAQAGQAVPHNQLPIAVLHEHNGRHTEDIVCIRLEDFLEWFGE